MYGLFGDLDSGFKGGIIGFFCVGDIMEIWE